MRKTFIKWLNVTKGGSQQMVGADCNGEGELEAGTRPDSTKTTSYTTSGEQLLHYFLNQNFEWINFVQEIVVYRKKIFKRSHFHRKYLILCYHFFFKQRTKFSIQL